MRTILTFPLNGQTQLKTFFLLKLFPFTKIKKIIFYRFQNSQNLYRSYSELLRIIKNKLFLHVSISFYINIISSSQLYHFAKCTVFFFIKYSSFCRNLSEDSQCLMSESILILKSGARLGYFHCQRLLFHSLPLPLCLSTSLFISLSRSLL